MSTNLMARLLGEKGSPHYGIAATRRDFFTRAGGGFGAVALAGLVASDTRAEGREAAQLAHHDLPRGRARSVIFLFMEGGPSHIDLLDPKPEVNRLAGQKLPASFGTVITAMGEQDSPILFCPRQWKQHGQGGLWMSDWIPHLAGVADDIAVLRSCWCDGLNHVGSVCQMNTGSILAGRPSLGAWVNYGLGTENSDLPAFVVLTDSEKKPLGGVRNWGAGFMPSSYQGAPFSFGDEPVPYIRPPDGLGGSRQRGKLDVLQQLNNIHAEPRRFRTDLEARIRAGELAYRMQAEIPEAVALDQEPESLRKLYGIGQKATDATARNCILARRLVERGVRFVQVYSGSGSAWDAHANIEKNHSERCAAMDQPVAALIKDLKQRGLLDSTLVVWGGEFGRTPMSEQGDGRDHNPWGFSMWMAGGGIPGGRALGATDALGLRAVEDRLHIHDLHATILYAMGLDHRQLHYVHHGRRESPTINTGEVYHKVFG
ncbi:MAG TPA: DUF1501 domain-containing protein [Verrucomicrobiales bacterium]|nr:DUF1501 domain-containing protein [Verrucomicrobiales bacterium]